MASRLRLLAVSARNQVGRSLGLSAAYTAGQVVTAKESWAFWSGKGASPNQAAALLGSEDGETSFLWSAVGDHGEAHSIFQWHSARISIIKSHTGIDLLSPHVTHLDGLNAAFWEMSNSASAYRRVWNGIIAAPDIESAVTELVVRYEQSGSQARDIARRTSLATYWHDRAASEGWGASA